jgi:hypothetical protein
MTLHLSNSKKISTYRATLLNYRVAITMLAAYNYKKIAMWIPNVLEKLG